MPNHQVLIIEPQNELKFKGHFELGYTTYMRLTNPTSDTVLFKIKTTAPKKYCVRPNSGSLEPNSKVDIAITPQPVCVDSNEKHKHKFMVQSVVAPEAKCNIDQAWKEINPEQMMDYKLKCVFEAPRSAVFNDSGDNVTQSDATKKRVVADEAKPAPVKGTLEDPAVKRNDENYISTTTNNTLAPKPATVGDTKSVSELSQLQLREEERLRHENLQLKEDLLRLRSRPTTRRHSYGPGKIGQGSILPWIATAIGMALLGIIIGKFFI